MGDPLWINDVSLLYRDGRIKQLVPTRDMSYTERVNALVRLVIISTMCIYVYNRDSRYVLYGVFCSALLTLVARIGRPSGAALTKGSPPADTSCTHPTPNNPFANVLLTDYKYNPNRPPACNVDDVSGEMKRAYAANSYRNAGDFSLNGFDRFYTMPDTSLYQAGREAFADAVYGNAPTCKTDQSRCGQTISW